MGLFNCFMLPEGCERRTLTSLVPARPGLNGRVPSVNAPPPRYEGLARMRTRRVRGNALLVTATTLALALAAGCSGGAGAAPSSGIE